MLPRQHISTPLSPPPPPPAAATSAAAPAASPPPSAQRQQPTQAQSGYELAGLKQASMMLAQRTRLYGGQGTGTSGATTAGDNNISSAFSVTKSSSTIERGSRLASMSSLTEQLSRMVPTLSSKRTYTLEELKQYEHSPLSVIPESVLHNLRSM